MQSHASGPSNEAPRQTDCTHFTDVILRRVELQDEKQADQAELAHQQSGLTTPTPRAQQQDAPGLPPWMDGDRTVLLSNTPLVPFQLFPTISRPLPGGHDDITGLVGSSAYFACDVYAEQGSPHIACYPPHSYETLVDYDVLEGWLSLHLPPGNGC